MAWCIPLLFGYLAPVPAGAPTSGAPRGRWQLLHPSASMCLDALVREIQWTHCQMHGVPHLPSIRLMSMP